MLERQSKWRRFIWSLQLKIDNISKSPTFSANQLSSLSCLLRAGSKKGVTRLPSMKKASSSSEFSPTTSMTLSAHFFCKIYLSRHRGNDRQQLKKIYSYSQRVTAHNSPVKERNGLEISTVLPRCHLHVSAFVKLSTQNEWGRQRFPEIRSLHGLHCAAAAPLLCQKILKFSSLWILWRIATVIKVTDWPSTAEMLTCRVRLRLLLLQKFNSASVTPTKNLNCCVWEDTSMMWTQISVSDV